LYLLEAERENENEQGLKPAHFPGGVDELGAKSA